MIDSEVRLSRIADWRLSFVVLILWVSSWLDSFGGLWCEAGLLGQSGLSETCLPTRPTIDRGTIVGLTGWGGMGKKERNTTNFMDVCYCASSINWDDLRSILINSIALMIDGRRIVGSSSRKRYDSNDSIFFYRSHWRPIKISRRFKIWSFLE